MNILSFPAALTLVVIGALQVTGVTTLDDRGMLGILFILLGVVALAGAVPADRYPWSRRG